jgi:glc operon protein GlcG
MRSKQCLTSEELHAMAAASRAEAAKIGINITVAIADDGGNLLYLERLDGAKVMSIEIATQKARTSAISHRPTALFQERVEKSSVIFLAVPGILPLQGGMPILAGSECLGGVGVSGGTAEQDEQIASAGIAALKLSP